MNDSSPQPEHEAPQEEVRLRDHDGAGSSSEQVLSSNLDGPSWDRQREVARREHAEAELAQERGFSEALLRTARALVLVVDREGRIVRFNRECEQTTGYSEQEVQGRSLWGLLVPEAEAVPEAFQDLLDGAAERLHHEVWRTRGGDLRKIAWSSTSISSAPGHVDFILATGIDVTEREETAQALTDSLERIQAVLATAVDGIITIDSRGIIDSANPAAQRLFGYTIEELLGRNVSMLMPAPFAEEHDDYLRRYLATRKPQIIGIGREVRGLRKDGTTFPMELAVSEFRAGDQLQFAGVVRDISERRRSEQQMIQQEKLAAVGQLASGVAHEVGNPLSSISALVQTVMRKTDNDLLREKLELIGKHIHRISTTLQQMVGFARPPRSEWLPKSVNDVVHDAVEIVRHDRRARDVAIHVELAALPSTVVMPDLLEQVFINLVLNAFDSLEDATERTLRVTSRVGSNSGKPSLVVSVEDSGAGVPEELRDRIFEPFFSTKSVGKGTGLGLSVSFGILREHEGDLRVEASDLGGACFVVEIPVRSEHPEQRSRSLTWRKGGAASDS